MNITLSNGQSIDTERDLTAAERHVLQKLFIWESMAKTIEEFRESRERALRLGWNDSGPVVVSKTLRMVMDDLDAQVVARLAAGRGQTPAVNEGGRSDAA